MRDGCTPFALRRLGPWVVLGVLLALALPKALHRAWSEDRPAPPRFEHPIVFAQVPVDSVSRHAAGTGGGTLRLDYGDGARIVRMEPDGTRTVLTKGFASACEMDVSFDGERILFAGKRKVGDPWNVFEMRADGSAVRQVTRDLGDCRSPAYQSTLYTIVSTEPWYQVMFTSTAAGERNEYGSGLAKSLYTTKLDGSEARRITFNLSDDMDPFLMPDGRILYAAWQRMDMRRGARGRVALFGVNADGVDGALYGSPHGARIQHMPCATKEIVVFVAADHVGWDGAGELATVERRRPYNSFRKITNLTRDGWLYHAPSPLRDGRVLAARRPATGGGTHGLVRVDPATGTAEHLYDDPQWHDMHPRLLAPRPEPDGRSSSVSEKYDWSKLYCLDAHRMEPKMRGMLPPGTIRALRVIEGVPLRGDDPLRAEAWPTYVSRDRSAGTTGIARRRLMGVVPVAADGSFQVELPPDLPIQLQTLDEHGMALRTCGWIWAKQREPRGCIGCHEDPELTPENRFVEALKHPAPKLTLPPERRRTVDFRRDVMPIVSRVCAPCHDKRQVKETPLDLSERRAGTRHRAYVSLLAGILDVPDQGRPVAGRYVHPGRARTSPLVWRLFGRNTSRPWDATWSEKDTAVNRMPPPQAKTQLSDADRRTIVEWIDLGALWDGDPNWKPEERK